MKTTLQTMRGWALGLALSVVFKGLVCTTLQADNIYWTNTAGGGWSTPANWNTGTVPGPLDNAFVTNEGAYTLSLNVDVTVLGLTLGSLDSAPILSNAGHTLLLNGASLIDRGAILDVVGGTIGGSGSLNIQGTINWSGGTVVLPCSLASNGVMNISAGFGTVYLGNALTNAGTVNWLSGYLRLQACTYPGLAGPIVNLAGGLWDIQCDQYLYYDCGRNSNGYFKNAGRVQKSAGSGATDIYVPLDNSGTVSVLQGTLNLNGGGSMEGTFNATAGTIINFNGSLSYGTAPALNGTGTIRFASGSLTLQSDLIPNLQMVGGTLSLADNFQGGTITNLTLGGVTLSGDHAVSGTFNWAGATVGGSLTVLDGGAVNWSGGTAGGAVTIASNGVMNISAGFGTVYLGNALTNAGTVNWLSGYLRLQTCTYPSLAGPIVNLEGGLWDIQCDQYLYYDCGRNSNGYFKNAGRVQKSAGSERLTSTFRSIIPGW